jgi:hypothetical protein
VRAAVAALVAALVLAALPAVSLASPTQESVLMDDAQFVFAPDA